MTNEQEERHAESLVRSVGELALAKITPWQTHQPSHQPQAKSAAEELAEIFQAL